MQGRVVVGLWARADGAASASCKVRRHDQLRLMVTKGPNRAAVHGTRLPVTETLPNMEEVEMEINKGKQEKEKKIKEVEMVVDSHIKRSDGPYTAVD